MPRGVGVDGPPVSGREVAWTAATGAVGVRWVTLVTVGLMAVVAWNEARSNSLTM
jgi:hypothetical protein